jgi:hypothetical protein
MENLEDALAEIKALECPTGNIKNCVRRILKDHQIANQTEITVSRNHMLDKGRARGYSAKVTRDDGLTISVLAASGMDDYVVKVIDAAIIKEKDTLLLRDQPVVTSNQNVYDSLSE